MKPPRSIGNWLCLPLLLLVAVISLMTFPTAAAETYEISFQQGVNGFAGTVDTYIAQAEAAADHGASASIEWDADDPQGTTQSKYALIRFDNIFGPGQWQIPAGSFIQSAVLSYTVFDTGSPADVNEVLVDWSEDATWNDFGGDAGVQADEYAGSVGTALGNAAGTQSIDVTASLSAWAVDPSANRGWIVRPTGTDGVDIRSSEYATAGRRPRLVVTYDDTASLPPDPPVLNGPADGAGEVSTSPALDVYVSDPEGDLMTVAFWGREAPGGTAEEFTIVALPDTQNESQYYPAVFISQTQWIAANAAAENIVFVTHLGDIVNTANSTAEWGNADAAMDLLDPAGIPYSVGPGNHDLPLYTSPSYYNTYFGIARFSGKSWYGGNFGSDNYNNYSLFSASGMGFILINLQFNPTSAMLDWADALLKANADRRAIVVSHSILNTNNTFTSEGAPIFNALKDNANLFLMLCGHMHASSDGAAYRTEEGDDGHTIHIMLADYQDYPNGGNGYLRLLRFSPADNKIFVTTYSPYIGQSITTFPDQMELEYGMSESFQEIGENASVASGSDTFLDWPGLMPFTEYEWYVTLSDGVRTTSGPIWSFTTTGLLADLNRDCDVDGSDLAELIADMSLADLAELGDNLVQTVCP